MGEGGLCRAAQILDPGAALEMYGTLHLPARLVPRLRVTSPQPPSFRQRIATAQEGDECPSGSRPNNLPTFATTHGY